MAVSPETAHLISQLLAQNVAEGSQIAGKVPGYRVAGKTGTAQKSITGGHGYIAGATVASFVGYLPPESPQLLCLVVIDSPQTDGRWGNTVAGPVFNAICVEAARYLGISKTNSFRTIKCQRQNPNTSTVGFVCRRIKSSRIKRSRHNYRSNRSAGKQTMPHRTKPRRKNPLGNVGSKAMDKDESKEKPKQGFGQIFWVWVAGLTILSKVAGLARDIILFGKLSASSYIADAYNYAYLSQAMCLCCLAD